MVAGATARGGDGVDAFETTGDVTFSGVFFNGNAGGDDFFSVANVVTFANSTLLGGQDDDIFEIDVLSNSIVNGNKGGDTIDVGASSASTIRGGQDNDKLCIDTISNSVANGNKGNDIISIDTTLNSSIFGGEGNDQIFLNGDINNPFTDISSTIINGNTGDDLITLGAAVTGFSDSTVFGGAGDDTITAVAVVATDVDLILSGDDGNDDIIGGAGADTIIGGAGADTMTGGTGADTFEFASLADTFTGALSGGVTDVITDFTSGTDELDLLIAGTVPITAAAGDGTFATALANANTFFTGNPDVYYIATGVLTGATAGDYLFIANGAGSTQASGAIGFTAGFAPAAGDIV